MYCSNCGAQLADGASFCSNCGEKTLKQAQKQQAPKQQAPMGQAPMGQAPMGQAPMGQAPMGQAPMGQAPMGQAPMGQAPMGQAPMGQAPIGQAPIGQAPMQQAPMFQSPPKNKRKGLGCLIAIFAFIGVIIAIAVTSSQLAPTQGKATEQPKTAEELKAEGLAFDEKSWNDFLKIYEAHNDFMGTVDLYAQGKVSKLDFYDYCKDAEKWFGNTSLKFDYAETDDEKEYLSTFSIFALSDQIAAKNVIKYIDSNSTKDLSKAREEIERATQAAMIIVGNRAVFLKSIGLTTEETNEILNKAIADMEKNEAK